MDKSVKVVEEQSMQHFDLLLIWEKVLKLEDQTTRRYCGNVINLCFWELRILKSDELVLISSTALVLMAESGLHLHAQTFHRVCTLNRSLYE